MKKLCLIAAVAASVSVLNSAPASAHEMPECRCESGMHENHHSEDTDYSRAFREGSPNLFSPHTLGADNFALLYAHNFFWSTLPRSSNPAFWFKYSPIDNLQIDALTSLRSPLEVELGLAYQLLDEYQGSWLSLTPRLSFNFRGNLVGGELSASKFIIDDLWQVALDARVLSSGSADGIDRPVAALGASTMVRVWKHWHLYGDLVLPLDSELLQRNLLWSAGIKKRIPHTPHVLTLYVGNSQEQSLSGRTLSPKGDLGDLLRAGFVFSINIDDVSQLPAEMF